MITACCGSAYRQPSQHGWDCQRARLDLRQHLDHYTQQRSASVPLVAGQRYYLEALQKEGGGGDHVEVAWAGPGIVDGNGLPSTNVIAGCS